MYTILFDHLIYGGWGDHALDKHKDTQTHLYNVHIFFVHSLVYTLHFTLHQTHGC